MKTGIALVVALGIGVGMSAVSAHEQGDGKKYDKGSTVTLQGAWSPQRRRTRSF
jgi:hypothetical protein